MVKGFELDCEVMESLNDSENKHTSGHKLSKWWKKKNLIKECALHSQAKATIDMAMKFLMKVENF
jgi:hypothetical protein